MIHFDWWYGEPQKPENCDVAVNFYPNDGLYRGNMYKKGTNSCIGDFISDDSVAIEQVWPWIFKGEDEMDKREMIEKVVKTLIEYKDTKKYSLRMREHRYDDAKEDGASDKMLKLYQKDIDEKADEIKELEMLIDFMQELHYEEVK